MKRSEPEQYLYEHPNLLDDSFSVSMTEAERWAKEHPASASAFIARAKEKHPEIPEEKWADFEKAAAKQEKTARQAPVVRFRWWYVAVAAVVLIVLTFTLVPPARAWAESAIRYIVTVLEGGVDITQEGEEIFHGTVSPEDHYLPSDDEDGDEIDYLETTFPNLSEFTAYTGYRPVRIMSDAFSVKEIEYQSVPNVFDKLCTTYESKNGVLVYVWEVWGNERGASIFENENDVLIQTTTLDGKQVVGYVDFTAGECILEVILDDSNLTIMYLGDVDYQEILDALQYS